MRYRKLTATGDFSFGSGLLNFWINQPEAVAQSVKTRLELWTGEWYQDLEAGTPYMEGVIGKHSQQTADTTIQNRITSTDGVTSLEDYSSELDPDSRALSVSGTLNTVYGPTPIEIQNYVIF